MSILPKLAVSLGVRDEKPNVELAKQLADKNDKKAVQELVDNLNNKDKNIQSDCIKVLYELGALKPELVAPHAAAFIALLDNKNNPLQWGAMTAIDHIAALEPKLVYKVLPKVMDIADKGSVITRDHGVGILIKLCAVKQYADDAFELLIEQLKKAPSNQLPMYAENAAPVITADKKAIFIKTISARLDDMDKESRRKRVEKVITKVNKK
jgi:hypothetical protein